MIYDQLDGIDIRETQEALRNEATSSDALNQPDRAARLRAHADKLDRQRFATRGIAYKPAPVQVVIEPSEGADSAVDGHQYQRPVTTA